MLSEVNLDVTLGKKEFKARMDELEKQLAALQIKVRQNKIPVVIVFEGWGASGKGTYISRVVNSLDPRYFDVRTTGKVTEDKQMRPFLWSFWTYLPPKGQIVIMDKSWHRLIIPSIRENWKLSNMEMHGFYYDVNAFERQLTEDGYLIIKIFLHISKEEQHKRFKHLADDPTTSWRVDEHDWKQNEDYDHNSRDFEKMLRMSSTTANPWTIVAAEDKRFGTIKVMETIIQALEARISASTQTMITPPPAAPSFLQSTPQTSILQGVNPNETIIDAEYKEALEHYQEKMRMLGNKMYAKRRSCALVYEGWDAAGKGGNIKRLTAEIDPRCYTVVPVAAPMPSEISRHYLWRFMVKMPKDGHLTIFDRSWYGRVLVERVDELTPTHVWERAYNEINEMESHLVGHGMILLKFWLHIDKDEQLRRFEDRQNDPSKHHKITDDDWHNRSKWDHYETAADDMISRTHTPHAPWIIVESNNKKYARIKTLQTVTDALDDAMR